jgi:hypothetical protein
MDAAPLYASLDIFPPFSPAENSGLESLVTSFNIISGSQNNIRRDVKSSCDIPRGCDRLTLFTLSLHLCDS